MLKSVITFREKTYEYFGPEENVTIPSDTLIANDDINVTFSNERKNFVRHIGFYYTNGTS